MRYRLHGLSLTIPNSIKRIPQRKKATIAHGLPQNKNGGHRPPLQKANCCSLTTKLSSPVTNPSVSNAGFGTHGVPQTAFSLIGNAAPRLSSREGSQAGPESERYCGSDTMQRSRRRIESPGSLPLILRKSASCGSGAFYYLWKALLSFSQSMAQLRSHAPNPLPAPISAERLPAESF